MFLAERKTNEWKGVALAYLVSAGEGIDYLGESFFFFNREGGDGQEEGFSDGFLFQGREWQLGEDERKREAGCRSFEKDGFRVRVFFNVSKLTPSPLCRCWKLLFIGK